MIWHCEFPDYRTLGKHRPPILRVFQVKHRLILRRFLEKYLDKLRIMSVASLVVLLRILLMLGRRAAFAIFFQCEVKGLLGPFCLQFAMRLMTAGNASGLLQSDKHSLV
jgi:hypothetical protein